MVLVVFTLIFGHQLLATQYLCTGVIQKLQMVLSAGWQQFGSQPSKPMHNLQNSFQEEDSEDLRRELGKPSPPDYDLVPTPKPRRRGLPDNTYGNL